MKIGILQTGLVPEPLQEIGEYPVLFEKLLAGQGFTFETYAVVREEFPKSVTECEGWIVTGSRHGAYEDHAWIPPLEDFIRASFAASVPMVGICFGHQIIAQAMGGTVVKFEGGWAVGRQSYGFNGQEIAQNAWHQDQVVALPEGADVIGSNGFCANAALVYGDKAFTVQWHPEFEADFIDGLIEHRGKGTVPDDLLAKAADQLAAPTQNALLAEQIGTFFKERRVA